MARRRARRGARDTDRTAGAAPAHRSRFPEQWLVRAIHAGLALILLTPLVASPVVFYPFSVGKAVWARALIAIVFALWAVLALARPQWRPRPGAILVLLGATLAAGVVSAWLGVSPVRSLWSTYTRMDGLVNAAHWFALVVVLAAVVRTTGDWARLLNVNLAVGLLVAALAVARLYAPDVGASVWGPEPRYPRISGSTGNPLFLGAYLQAVALLAAGFLARSWAAAPAAPGGLWLRRSFWTVTGAGALLGIAATGSLGALAGLGAGAATAAGLCAWLGGSARARRFGSLALGGLGAVVLALALVIALRAAAPAGPAFDNVLLERATSVERIATPLAKRLRTWQAGLEALAERPLLGWGPENYHVASGRYIAQPEERARVRDRAHNATLEAAATGGVAGLVLYLALWGFTARIVVRAARAAAAPDRMLIVFAGAALAGWFVQSQSSFHSPSSWLQHMLLLGFVAHLEASLPGRSRAPPAWLARALGALRLRPARVAAGLAAAALAAGSLASSHAIHAGAAAVQRAEFHGPFPAEMARSIEAFGPLANGPRVIMFNNVAANWEVLASRDAAEAGRLLEWMDREAAAALAAEPESWVVHHALARLYRKVAVGDPAYAARARGHLERSLALAPNLDPLEAPRPGEAGP